MTEHRPRSALWRAAGVASAAAWLLATAAGVSADERTRYTQVTPAPPKTTEHGHIHAPVPAVYANAHIPVRVWTDPKMLAKGKEIYVSKCAVCHGERGDGKGPGSAGLPLKPADLTDAKMVAEMPGNYWFWRVSEGGLVEPYKSMASAMPAWKAELSVADRWAVIAYAHTLSGHTGPHTPSEHPEMGKGHAH